MVIARRHWAVLVRPALVLAAAITAAVALGYVLSPSSGDSAVDTALGVLTLVFAARLGWRVARWRATRVVLTDRRVLEISGVVARRVISLPLAGVSDVVYRRSIGGRLLGYGDLFLATRGPQPNEIVRISDPDRFYRAVADLVTGGPDENHGPPRPLDPDDEDTGPLPRVVV